MGFDYFDINISIYLWRCLLTLVVGTAFLILKDGAKQAGLVDFSGIYLLKLCPVAVFFEGENLGAYLYMVKKALVTFFVLLLLCCILLWLPLTGSNYLTNRTRLGLLLS